MIVGVDVERALVVRERGVPVALLAMEAGEAGADYVAFGAFYDTTSKPKEKLEKWGTPTPDILHWWSEFMTVPCVAIGGITLDNARDLPHSERIFYAVIGDAFRFGATMEGIEKYAKAWHPHPRPLSRRERGQG